MKVCDTFFSWETAVSLYPTCDVAKLESTEQMLPVVLNDN